MLKNQEAYVLEESIVDPANCFMQTRTRNLSHQRLVTVEEVQTYTKSPEDEQWTLADCRASVKSNFGTKWAGLGSKIEGVGVHRFKEHLQKSKQAMTWILEKLRKRDLM